MYPFDHPSLFHFDDSFLPFQPPITRIYVKDYADAKFGCVPVAQPKTCHYRPRELPGRSTKGPGIPRDLPGMGTYTLPCPMVASFGLRNRDIHDFLACIMSDADANLKYFSKLCILKYSDCCVKSVTI